MLSENVDQEEQFEYTFPLIVGHICAQSLMLTVPELNLASSCHISARQ